MVPPPSPNLRQRLFGWLNVPESELPATLGLAVYLLLGIASAICLKAVSSALFLGVYEARLLPWADLATTASAGLAVSLYLRVSNRLPLAPLICFTLLFLIGSLLGFWLLLGTNVPLVAAAVYVWAGVFTVLIPSQVWSLAGAIFDGRQARRAFPLIGGGGILGAALGGEFASVAGPRFGAENLLPGTAVFLAAALLIVLLLARRVRIPQVAAEPAMGRSSLAESFQRVLGERYLTLMMVTLALSMITSTFIKYQFNAIARLEFGADASAMTSFFGDFYGYIAVLSFLFHLLMTSRLLRWAGLGLALFILPLSLVAGAGALVVSTSLWAAVLARGCDQGFRHSLDRSAFELLYLPLPSRVRNEVKSFLDMVVSRGADGLASILLLLALEAAALRVQQIGWMTGGLVLLWLGAVWRLRGEYVEMLRASIERKDTRAEELLRQLSESASPARLEDLLRGSDQRAVETAIDWMQYGGLTAGQTQFAALIEHPSSEIRRKAMHVAAAQGVAGCEAEAERFLELEQDVDARWLAFDYLEKHDLLRSRVVMHRLLKSPDRALAAAAAARLLHAPADEQGPAEGVFDDFVRAAIEAGHASRAVAARLLGLAPPSEKRCSLLSRFLHDRDPNVVRAALLSAAALKPRGEIPRLLELLADRHLRSQARAALASFGNEVLPVLKQGLLDSERDLAIHRELPRVLGLIGGTEASRILLDALPKLDRTTAARALMALTRIRRTNPSVNIESPRLAGLLHEEMRGFYEERVFLSAMPDSPSGDGSGFLRRALDERAGSRIDWVFRLLALRYPRREILDAYYWITSGRPHLRSNALEFLDSLLDNPERQMVLQALEAPDERSFFESARMLFGLEPAPYATVLRRLLERDDPWLQSCTSYVAGEAGRRDLLPLLKTLRDHADPLLAETASAACLRIEVHGLGRPLDR